MTQEQIIRSMMQGFIDDPPNSEFQRGFLAAVCLIANEVMGFEDNEPLLLKANGQYYASIQDAHATAAKLSHLKLINGGKNVND